LIDSNEENIAKPVTSFYPPAVKDSQDFVEGKNEFNDMIDDS
jgi:hypothetical protein